MFGVDPPRTDWDLRFSIFGIPVRVHPVFWFVALLLGLNQQDPVVLAIWILVVFVSVLVHEMGHATAMRAYGYYPSITLYGLGGFTSYNARRGGLESIVITAAGPAAGFALAGLLYLVLAAARVDMEVSVGLPYVVNIGMAQIVGSLPLTIFIDLLFLANILWGILNLLPIYPLDGGQIAREVLSRIHPGEATRWSLMISFTAAILLAAVALIQWNSLFTAVFFGYLAYMNYTTLALYSSRGRW